ncbi:MAG TPA: hypothetical protein VF877_11605 [Gaiellaceae bacterium]
MVVEPSPHGDFHYAIAAVRRTGKERVHEYAAEDPLRPGDVVRLQGRYWLIAGIEPTEGAPAHAQAKPARYRLRLRHPDGREEIGVFRRFRPDAPRLGHAFTTLERGRPISWEVVDSRLAEDEDGEPYLELVAERDYSELEEMPDHELEHTLALEQEELPPGAAATLAHAEEAGLAVELVALEPGEEPDWEAAERFIDALVIEEVEDDVLELSGVDPDRDPKERWLETVKQRLLADLEQFRADVESDHKQIEQWSFRDGRIFASVGSSDEEADPESGHGWMVRLADAEALGAAGFARVRKAELS